MKKIVTYLIQTVSVLVMMLALLVEPSHLQSWAIPQF